MRETSHDAVMSPMASQAQIINTVIMGSTRGAYTVSLKVCTQMKLTTGASSMVLRSKYPVAAAMMIPVSSPMMTLVDFMMGDPKRSQRMMVMNTEKPRPRYSAEPQGSACGAVMSGQRAKKSVGLACEQGPLPPSQPWNPDSMRLMPMS